MSDYSNLTLPLHVAYVHIANSSASVHGNASIEAHLDPLDMNTDSHTQQLPFDYKVGEDLLVHPMAIEVNRASLEVTVLVYTYLRDTKLSIHSMEASISGLAASSPPHSPVFTSSSANGTVEQAWAHTVVLSNDTTSSSIHLAFYGCRHGETCREHVYSAEIPVSLYDEFFSWDLFSSVQVDNSNTGTIRTTCMCMYVCKSNKKICLYLACLMKSLPFMVFLS